MNKTIKLAVFLAIVSAISGGLLSFVNSVTAPLIEAQKTVVTNANGFVAGTYEGSAKGFSGSIYVTCTVDDNNIVSIEIDESENGNQLLNDASRADFAQKIIDAQSSDVNVVSGATYSSQGIKDAVYNALKDAMK